MRNIHLCLQDTEVSVVRSVEWDTIVTLETGHHQCWGPVSSVPATTMNSSVPGTQGLVDCNVPAKMVGPEPTVIQEVSTTFPFLLDIVGMISGIIGIVKFSFSLVCMMLECYFPVD